VAGDFGAFVLKTICRGIEDPCEASGQNEEKKKRPEA